MSLNGICHEKNIHFRAFLTVFMKVPFAPSEINSFFMEQDGRENFCLANVEGYFLGVCAQVGCFERRHETEIYCILLGCVEGTVEFCINPEL